MLGAGLRKAITMTPKQRADVVELLRCAADCWHTIGCGIGGAWHLLQCDGEIHDAAVKAWDMTARNHEYPTVIRGYTYADMCLEAAARVEEGYPDSSKKVRR